MRGWAQLASMDAGAAAKPGGFDGTGLSMTPSGSGPESPGRRRDMRDLVGSGELERRCGMRKMQQAREFAQSGSEPRPRAKKYLKTTS